jgi:hypothetical protein
MPALSKKQKRGQPTAADPSAKKPKVETASRRSGQETPTTPRSMPRDDQSGAWLPSPETLRFEASGIRMPRKIVNDMDSVGGAIVVRKLAITTVEFTDTESAAYELYVTWLLSLPEESDPVVSILVNLHVGDPANIYAEIMTILTHYAPMRSADFRGGRVPVLPAFVPGRPLPLAIRFHSAQIALHKVVDAIRNPGPGYPGINALPRGSPICTLQQTWAGAVINFVPITKR